MNSEQLYQGHPTIETQWGQFNPLDPTFDIRDVAGGLSKKCRFNGQCSSFYSVAQHSIMVSDIMAHLGVGDPLEGLLHDGNEAYLPDVPSPYKHMLPQLWRLEDRVDDALRAHFGLPTIKTRECAYADCIALMIEAKALMPSRGTGVLWSQMEYYRQATDTYGWVEKFPVVTHRPTEMVESLFLMKYEELKR